VGSVDLVGMTAHIWGVNHSSGNEAGAADTSGSKTNVFEMKSVLFLLCPCFIPVLIRILLVVLL